MRDRGYTLQDNEAEQLVSHLDTDYNGQVDYLDWLAAMIDWHKVCCLHSLMSTQSVSNRLELHILHLSDNTSSSSAIQTWCY